VNLTAEQVLALAPDPGSASAARKLAVARPWRGLGRSDRALWGECQGSALYQVSVDLADMATKCSCPSRKFPCKHALGLLLLAAASPSALAAGDPPEWVGDWLTRRAASAERKEARAVSAADRVPDPAAQARRAEQRLARVTKGLEALDLWLSDLVRGGLAGVESQPAAYWEAQAARLVDAQAPALASRVRRLAHVVGGDARWPARLLDELGRIAMLTHAFRRIDALPGPLQADVKQLIGWSLTQDEVLAQGETLADEWLVAGQWTDDDERMRAQRTWLAGARTGRTALVLQFAAGAAPFAENLIPGTAFAGEIVYWPSAEPQRALVRARTGTARAWSERLPGFDRVEAFLAAVGEATARQPWLDRTVACLRGVTPVHRGKAGRVVRDALGMALGLAPVDTWSLFALSGGAPVDVVAEWDGEVLLPLAAIAEGTHHVSWKGPA
jgi:hypothetical protein